MNFANPEQDRLHTLDEPLSVAQHDLEGLQGWLEEDTGMFYLQKPCTYCLENGMSCYIIRTTSANPNPRTSCSSCVALYRNCSLTQEPKRPMSLYETGQPVTENLHGLFEEDEFPATKNESARVTNRTRLLRDWVDAAQRMYPTDEEKNDLAQQSGLSDRQVRDWFSNLRRKQRKMKIVKKHNRRSGSPMPIPMERWRNVPPEENVSLEAIRNANTFEQPLYRYDSSSSVGSMSDTSRASSSANKHTFYCTFCAATFSRKADWTRHEKSRHVPLDLYFCCIENEQLVQDGAPFCGLCGSPIDTIHDHDITACTQRSIADRTFKRRDHLLQHLIKFHRVANWTGCDWNNKCKSWRNMIDDIESRCGICQQVFSSWTLRCNHVAEHFKNGSTMMDWVGKLGLN